MYLCIYLYIYSCLNIKGQKQEFPAIFAFTLHLDTQVLTSHIGKMLLSIWRYCYNRRTESLLDMFFLLVTLKLWEPHEIRRIENSVEEKMGIEKIGESGMNFWLQSLHPFLPFVTFVMNSFPIHKRRTFWKV